MLSKFTLDNLALMLAPIYYRLLVMSMKGVRLTASQYNTLVAGLVELLSGSALSLPTQDTQISFIPVDTPLSQTVYDTLTAFVVEVGAVTEGQKLIIRDAILAEQVARLTP